MKNKKHNFHIFRENHKLNMQNNYIFVDTETKEEKIKEETILSFKLGCLIYWDKENNLIERKDFFNINYFWDYIEEKFNFTDELIFFAHNTDFDFKILDGYKQLIKRGWDVKNWYIQGKTFIIRLKKGKKILRIWDTMNYTPYALKTIGKVIGLKKLDIDFSYNTDNELLIYCRRDTEIIFKFIQYLITFLEIYELSRLKPTSASLSLNIFRHKFYSSKKTPIYIHGWKKAILLERDSYSGGITDCFQVGKINEMVYKLDINSMYPYVMKNYFLPYRLIYWCRSPRRNPEYIKKLFEKNKKKRLLIIRCKIFLPEKYAYILQKTKIDKMEKSCFLTGIFQTVLTTPEFEYVEKFGKIIEVTEIAIYQKRIIFKEFIDFFYSLRLDFKKEENKVYEQFCKLIMNSQYGKWGQKTIKYFLYKKLETSEIKNFGTIIDAETDERYQLIQFGNLLYKIQSCKDNSKESFVAISSFVTAYSRMLLIKYLMIAERKNVFYCDTDSLFVNEQGYKNLNSFVDNFKLGFLKLEEKSNNVIIYKPKFYEFGSVFKCKGIKKSSKRIDENDDNIKFLQERWERFKTSLKKGNLDKQIIINFEKVVNKNYDKGLKDKKGIVSPFKV